MSNRVSSSGSYGRLLSTTELGSFKFTETEYAADEYLPKHAHEEDFFCLTMKGRYKESSERSSYLCSPLTLAFHPAGTPHSVEFGGAKVQVFKIEMYPEWIGSIRESHRIVQRPVYCSGGVSSRLALRLFKEYRTMDSLSEFMIEGLLLEIFVYTLRSSRITTKRIPPTWLIKARDLLHDSFCQNLQLREIAKNVDIHPVHLATCFREHYGSTIGEYLRKLRIDFACSQIRDSDRPLTEIALSAGFCDQGHFSRSFKQHLGMSPSEYRLTFRNKAES